MIVRFCEVCNTLWQFASTTTRSQPAIRQLRRHSSLAVPKAKFKRLKRPWSPDEYHRSPSKNPFIKKPISARTINANTLPMGQSELTGVLSPSVTPLFVRTRAVSHPFHVNDDNGSPRHPAYMDEGPGPSHRPVLTDTQVGLYEACMAFVKRGILIADAESPAPDQFTPSLERLNQGLADGETSDAFLEAVIRGYGELRKMRTGLEHSHPRSWVKCLVDIVRKKQCGLQAEGSSLSRQEWECAKHVLVMAGTRPALDEVGLWAWEELERGPEGWARLFEVWAGIRSAVTERRAKSKDKNSNDDSQDEIVTRPIPLNSQYFAALIATASALDQDQRPLRALVNSLITGVESYITYPTHRKVGEKIFSPLQSLPDPSKALHYIRAVELGLIWRRSSDNHNINPHYVNSLLRRAMQQNATGYIEEIWERIKEAVDGTTTQSGWLSIDWSEPVDSPTPYTKSPPDQQEGAISVDPVRISTIELTQPIVGTLITAFAMTGKAKAADEVFEWITKPRDVKMGRSLYLWTCRLRGLRDCDDVQVIDDVYNGLLGDGFQPDLLADCSYLRAMFPRIPPGDDRLRVRRQLSSRLDKVFQFLDSDPVQRRYSGHIPIDLYNTIIGATLRSGNIDHAKMTFQHAIKAETQPNVVTFNHFLSYYSRARGVVDHEQISTILEQMESYHVEADAVTYTILLNCTDRDMTNGSMTKEVGDEYLRMMQSKGVRPNAVTYGTLVARLSKSGDWSDLEAARDMLQNMESGGTTASEIVYTSLILGYLRAHARLLPHAQGTKPSSNDCLQHTFALLNKMKIKGVHLNRVGHHALLAALIRSDQSETIEAALGLFERVKEEQARNGRSVHADTYSLVIKGLLDIRQVDKAKQVARQVRQESLTFESNNWLDNLLDRVQI